MSQRAWLTVWVTAVLGLTMGCSGVLNYESLLQQAAAIDLSDGLTREEAILVGQRYVILTGLDQDVSVWHIDEVKFINADNMWHVIFRTALDNKVGDRRGEETDAVIVAVDAKTGATKRHLSKSNP